MDIPTCYSVPDSILAGSIPRNLARQVCEAWQSEAKNVPDGCSNNWSEFTNFMEWLLPRPRWGVADPFVHLGDKDSIRARYGFLGDIVPLFYIPQDQPALIFRVGQRPYIYIQGSDGTSAVVAMRLPLQSLLNATQLLFPDIQLSSVPDRGHSSSDSYRALVMEHYPTLIDSGTTDPSSSTFGTDPKSWSTAQWSELNRMWWIGERERLSED